MRLPKHECDNCSGSGMIVNHFAVGLMVRRLREEAGVSLRRLAAELEVSPAFWSDIELGKRGSHYWTQEKYSRVLEIIVNVKEKSK